MTRGRSGWLGLTPYGTFTRYSSPALPGALMDQFTRRIIGFGVHVGDVDGIALCRMFNSAIVSKGAPKYLSSDNDPRFLYHQWQTISDNYKSLASAAVPLGDFSSGSVLLSPRCESSILRKRSGSSARISI
jgi:hypothetical protein